VWAVLAVGALLAAFAAYVLEPPPMTYENAPMPVLEEPVVAGTVVRFVLTRCARRAMPYPITRNLRNAGTGEVRLLPSVETQVEAGCTTVVSGAQGIPPDVPAGTYVLYGTALVRTLLRTHAVAWETAPFAVVAAPRGGV
jgi:hypothetical protein